MSNAQIDLDRQIRKLIEESAITSDQARLARALIEATGTTLSQAATAAKILEFNSPITPAHIRRNYRAGGLTFDWVNDALAASA